MESLLYHSHSKLGMSINRSKAYILPLLSYYVNLKFINMIVNTYLFLEEDLNNYIIVQYKDDLSSEFQEYILELSDSEYCKEIVRKDNSTYCIFFVNDMINTDYEHFVEGRFSRISDRNKQKILSFSISNYDSNNIEVITKIKQILYRDKKLKTRLEDELDVIIPEDSELASVPDLTDETLKL